jgi:hypothetical protein
MRMLSAHSIPRSITTPRHSTRLLAFDTHDKYKDTPIGFLDRKTSGLDDCIQLPRSLLVTNKGRLPRAAPSDAEDSIRNLNCRKSVRFQSCVECLPTFLFVPRAIPNPFNVDATCPRPIAFRVPLTRVGESLRHLCNGDNKPNLQTSRTRRIHVRLDSPLRKTNHVPYNVPPQNDRGRQLAGSFQHWHEASNS